ncbi:MAG: glycosyltransferase [Thermoanaerobaculales bacterium]
MPTYNSVQTLDWTLLSLRRQRGCEVEIVAVDSGSTDGTLECLDRWGVRVLYSQPGNIYQAVNIGIRSLSTEWRTYLNSDDYIYPDGYANLIDYGIASGAEVVYGRTDYVDWDGRFLFSFKAAQPSRLAALFASGVMGFGQPSAIFRQAVYHGLDGFRTDLRFVSDFDFFWRGLRQGRVFARFAGRSVAAFRLHEGQLSNRYRGESLAELRSLMAPSSFRGFIGRNIHSGRFRLSNIESHLLRVLRARSLRGPEPSRDR